MNHCPNSKLGQIRSWNHWCPSLTIAPIPNWGKFKSWNHWCPILTIAPIPTFRTGANSKLESLVPHLDHCPILTFELGQIQSWNHWCPILTIAPILNFLNWNRFKVGITNSLTVIQQYNLFRLAKSFKPKSLTSTVNISFNCFISDNFDPITFMICCMFLFFFFGHRQLNFFPFLILTKILATKPIKTTPTIYNLTPILISTSTFYDLKQFPCSRYNSA